MYEVSDACRLPNPGGQVMIDGQNTYSAGLGILGCNFPEIREV